MKVRLTLAIMALALVVSTGCSKPEDKIAKHIEKMGSIAEDNVDSPKDGVEELHEYYRDNLGDMLSNVGDMATELDKIEDPKERAERAKEMFDAIKEAAEAQKDNIQKFGEAAMKDKDAMEYGTKHMATYAAMGVALSESLGDDMKALEGLAGMAGMGSKRRSRRAPKMDLDIE